MRNILPDVGFAVRQVFFEVRNIFSKDFVAKATTRTGPPYEDWNVWRQITQVKRVGNV